MKKGVFLALFVFWAVVVGVIVAYLLKAQSTVPVANLATPTSTVITLQSVATHNSAASCWSIIHGQVYDLTAYVNKHPGGAQAILSGCGKDSSTDFDTMDRNPARPHPASALRIIQKYQIGKLQ